MRDVKSLSYADGLIQTEEMKLEYFLSQKFSTLGQFRACQVISVPTDISKHNYWCVWMYRYFVRALTSTSTPASNNK